MHGANPFSYWIILDSLSKCSWNTHTRKIYIRIFITYSCRHQWPNFPASTFKCRVSARTHTGTDQCRTDSLIQWSTFTSVDPPHTGSAVLPAAQTMLGSKYTDVFLLHNFSLSSPHSQDWAAITHIYVRLFIALLKLTSSYILVQMQPRPLVCGCDLEIAKKINK